MDNKKVSLTIDQKIYQRLSEYSTKYGTSVRFMLQRLLDDSISHDRYKDIFNKKYVLPPIEDFIKSKSHEQNKKQEPKEFEYCFR